MHPETPPVAPLQPSSLRTFSGLLSPKGPLSPRRSSLHSPPLPSPRSMPVSPASQRLTKTIEAPPEPMSWVWSCHKCHTRYPLGATRRCLHDGHYFCGGITVDPYTGKTKKHKSCASEFDYISWHKYGKWQRRLSQNESVTQSARHCERKCEFPSACHWKPKHTPKNPVTFAFLDEKSLDAEALNASTHSDKSNTPALKKTGLYIDKIVKAAEKRTSQLTTLLSTIDDEKNFSSTPGYIPSPISSLSKLPELPSLNGLGLSFPVMDFSNLTSYLDSPRSHPREKGKESEETPSADSPPELSTSATTAEGEDNDDDDNVNMTDWLSDDAISPRFKPDTNNIPFSIEPGHGPQASLADEEEGDLDDSPVSPRRNAWDWTAGDIGVALGSPTKPIYEETWDDPMEDEMEREWERELGLSERAG
ncbi:hypothetical protein ACLMJK_008100 [Lecanora helva]